MVQKDRVVTLPWIVPWTNVLLRSHHIQYIENDASFKANRPYCLVVPLGVIGDFRVPVDLAVSLTEKAQSYNTFYNALIQADPSLSLLPKDLPILGDLGSGLTSLARPHPNYDFLCYRHVLERLGSKAYPAIFVRRQLFTGSRAERYKTRADV
jgi:hypothetical protein